MPVPGAEAQLVGDELAGARGRARPDDCRARRHQRYRLVPYPLMLLRLLKSGLLLEIRRGVGRTSGDDLFRLPRSSDALFARNANLSASQ